MTIVWQPTLSGLQAAISGIPLIFVTDTGGGYDAPLSVTIDAPPSTAGVQADATALMGVGAVNVFARGQNYLSVPNVVLTGGGGSGATCTAVLTPFTVGGVKVTAAGAGYTSPPRVQFSGGGGTGASGTAVLSGGVVVGVNLANGGSGYTSAPAVSLSGGGGLGAQVVATVASLTNQITSVTLTGGGGGYSAAPTVSAASGTGAAILATINGSVTSLTTNNIIIVNASASQAAGYSPGVPVTIVIDPPDLPEGVQATATGIVPSLPASNAPIAVTITNAGSGYSRPPAVEIAGPDVPGVGAIAAIATVGILGPVGRPDGLSPLLLENGGTGYSSGSLIFTGTHTSIATGTFVVATNTVTSLQIVSGGTGYASPPDVTFVGGAGSGAAATVSTTPVGVAYVNVTNPGTGYLTVPTVNFISGSGSGASGTVQLNPTTVASVTVDTPGSGYVTPPEVAIEGGFGIGARATTTLELVGFNVTNGGYLYAVSPFPKVALSAVDGQGSGATATAGLALALISGDLYSLTEATAIATELAGIGAEYDAGIPIPVTKRAAHYVQPPPFNWFELDKATRFAASVSPWFSWPASWEMEPTGKVNIAMMRANLFNNALQVFEETGQPDQFIPNTWQPLFVQAGPAYSFFVVSQHEATSATTSPYPDNHPLSVQLAALLVTASELTAYLNSP